MKETLPERLFLFIHLIPNLTESQVIPIISQSQMKHASHTALVYFSKLTKLTILHPLAFYNQINPLFCEIKNVKSACATAAFSIEKPTDYFGGHQWDCNHHRRAHRCLAPFASCHPNTHHNAYRCHRDGITVTHSGHSQ